MKEPPTVESVGGKQERSGVVGLGLAEREGVDGDEEEEQRVAHG